MVEAVGGRRPIIAHYHCFKTAGASIIHSIRNSMGREFVLEIDKHPVYSTWKPHSREAVETAATENPDVACFTSHRMVPTVHRSTKFHVIPILFVRHPLLHAASTYRFDKKRGDRPERTAFAQERTFGEWLDHHMGDRTTMEAKNYQSFMYALLDSGKRHFTPGPLGRQVDLPALFERLDEVPFVGAVEAFDTSAARFEEMVQPHFPAFRIGTSANRTKLVDDWREEVAHVEQSLPKPVLTKFRAMNAQDYALHERYLARVGSVTQAL